LIMSMSFCSSSVAVAMFFLVFVLDLQVEEICLQTANNTHCKTPFQPRN